MQFSWIAPRKLGSEPERIDMMVAGDEIPSLLQGRSEAIGNKDIDRLLSLYSPEIVYFDLVPPLQYRGIDALRDRFLNWFGRFEGAIRQEIDQLAIWQEGNIAAASMLIHAGGLLTGGRAADYWVRVSNGFHRTGREWSIVHEHVSLPVDLESRAAVMDLNP